MPNRIQLKRTKGWRLPPNAMSVARPTRFGNPYKVGLANCGCRTPGECTHNVGRVETRQEAVELFRWWLSVHLPDRLEAKLAPLRGKDLACWCPLDQPCHADVLLELANSK